jgi:hypothetical protein
MTLLPVLDDIIIELPYRLFSNPLEYDRENEVEYDRSSGNA